MTATLREPEKDPNPRWQRGPMSAVAKATSDITTVTSISSAGMLPKHAHGRFSPTTTPGEKSMPVAKHLSYARSRSRVARSRRIDRHSFAHSCVHHDETPLPRQAPSSRPATAVVSVASRSIFKNVVQFAESAGGILLAIASWIVAEILAGCFAYAMAMHGILEATDDHGEPGDPMPSVPPDVPENSSRSALRVVAPPDTAQPRVDARRGVRPE